MFNFLAGALFFMGFAPYIWTILSGDTQPSPVSWAIWAAVDTLAFLAMRREGARFGQVLGATAGAWVVTLLAIFMGELSMGMVEWVSIIGAAAGIILWQKTGNAVFAIVCAQAAIFIGALPTFAGAYANPAQEDPIAWSIWLASCICALFAVRKWDLANALQPLTFTSIEVTMVFLVVVRPILL